MRGLARVGWIPDRCGWVLYPLALLAIAGLGWTKLEQPFGRDQIIHHWAASQWLAGASLYRDAWEVKPPALYLFHALAIRLIDATPRGVHLLELAWQLVFALVLMRALRPAFRQRWLAAMAPLACLAPYYAHVRPYAQTQAEILVGLPLFLAAWAALAAADASGPRRLGLAFGTGVAAGVTTAFKQILAPLPVAFIVAAVVFAVVDRRQPRFPWSAPLALGLPFAAGVGLVWGAILLWLWASGGAEAFLWTLFVWPVDMLAAADPAPLARLAESAAVLLAMLAPFVVLLLAAPPGPWRGAAAGSRGEPRWTAMLWLWLTVGLGVVLVQRVGWFTYHFLILVPPLALLALRAIDRLADDLGRLARLTGAERAGLTLTLVGLCLAGLAHPVGQTVRDLYRAFVVAGLDGEGYRRAAFPEYAQPAEVADFLRTAGRPGAVYAVESLAVPVLAGRTTGQPVPGQWLVLLPLPDRWRHVPEDLVRRPPAYFFVETAAAPLLAERYPGVVANLTARYRVVFASGYGRLYEWSALPPP